MTKLKPRLFETLSDKTFRILNSNPQLDLALTEVRRSDRAHTERDGGAFSILLEAQSHMMAPQGTYRIENAELGELHLFLVPIEQTEAGITYESVFS